MFCVPATERVLWRRRDHGARRADLARRPRHRTRLLLLL